MKRQVKLYWNYINTRWLENSLQTLSFIYKQLYSTFKYKNKIKTTSEIEVSMINLQVYKMKIFSPPWSEASSVMLLHRCSVEVYWY